MQSFPRRSAVEPPGLRPFPCVDHTEHRLMSALVR
jgi:hypothetical protein